MLRSVERHVGHCLCMGLVCTIEKQWSSVKKSRPFSEHLSSRYRHTQANTNKIITDLSSLTLVQHCTNVIQKFCVCWDNVKKRRKTQIARYRDLLCRPIPHGQLSCRAKAKT